MVGGWLKFSWKNRPCFRVLICQVWLVCVPSDFPTGINESHWIVGKGYLIENTETEVVGVFREDD